MSNRPALPASHPSNRGPSSSPSLAEPMEAEDVARGAVSGEGRGVRGLGKWGGAVWRGAMWAEAIPPLPQALGPPRPGLMPVSIIGAEDEDFEIELKTVRGRRAGKASVSGSPGPQPSSPILSVPSRLRPVLHPLMLSFGLLSLPISLSF